MTSRSAIKLSGETEQIERLWNILGEIQTILALPNKGAAAGFAADFMSQIMQRMLAEGTPLGFYEESTDTFDQLSHPLIDNLLTIFAERNKFTEDKANG
jgi:hypothetical protein